MYTLMFRIVRNQSNSRDEVRRRHPTNRFLGKKILEFLKKEKYQYCTAGLGGGVLEEGGGRSPALVCRFVCPGAKESLFSCSCTTAEPCSSRQQSTFLKKKKKSKNKKKKQQTSPCALSSIPPLLPNTYPTLFCPSCPLARSEVETCVSLHLHGRERKKSEVRSLPPPPLPLPSLPAEESRQTGAEHGTFINPRQIAKNPLHTRCCLQRGERGR